MKIIETLNSIVDSNKIIVTPQKEKENLSTSQKLKLAEQIKPQGK